MSGDPDVASAYRSGYTTFMGVQLAARPGALVPRPETELLARTTLEQLRQAPAPSPRLIDMCCGSGNLACALAVHAPGAQVWASDLTSECVSLCRDNVATLGLTDRLRVVQGDLFEPLIGLGLDGTIDVVVCNPPYISESRLSGERAALLELEPREAFAAGPYGISIHSQVIKSAIPFLRIGGTLALEVGAGQDRQVAALFARAKVYDRAETVADDNGVPRVVWARRIV